MKTIPNKPKSTNNCSHISYLTNNKLIYLRRDFNSKISKLIADNQTLQFALKKKSFLIKSCLLILYFFIFQTTSAQTVACNYSIQEDSLSLLVSIEKTKTAIAYHKKDNEWEYFANKTLTLASYYQQQRATKMALKAVEDNAQQIPNQDSYISIKTELLVKKAELLYDSGQYETAVHTFKKVLEIDSIHPHLTNNHRSRIIIAYGDSCLENYEYINASKVFEKAVMLTKNNCGTSDPLYLTSLNKLARAYKHNIRTSHKVIALLHKSAALNLKKTPEDHEILGHTFANLGEYYKYIKDLQKAASNYQKAFAIFETQPSLAKETADVLVKIADITSLQGNNNSALDSINCALSIYTKTIGRQHPATAYALTLRSDFYRLIGHSAEALQDAKEAVEIQEQCFGNNHPRLITGYAVLGNINMSIQKFNEAFFYYKKNLDIQIHQFGEQSQSLIVAYINIGAIAYFLKNYDSSIEYFQKALKLVNKYQGNETLDAADIYQNLGRVYEHSQQMGKAIEYTNTALRIKSKKLGTDHTILGSLRNNLGNMYQKNGEIASAKKEFKKALTVATNNLNKGNFEITIYNNELGYIYLEQGNLEASQKYFNASLQNNSFFDIHTENKKFTLPKVIHHKFSFFRAIKGMAMVHFEKFKDSDTRSIGLKALDYFYKCDELIHQIKNDLSEESDKIAYNKEVSDIYIQATQLSHLLYQQNKKSNNQYFEDALYFDDKNKAAVLARTLSEYAANVFGDIPEELLKKELMIRQKIERAERKLFENRDTTLTQKYSDTIFQLKRKLDHQITQYKKEFPEYYNLKYNNQKIDLSKIKNEISPDEALISFRLNDISVTTYLVDSKNESILHKKLPIDFYNDLKTYRKLLSTPPSPDHLDFEQFQLIAQNLYTVLLKSTVQRLPKTVKRVIIVPDNTLQYINFEALLTEKSDPENVESDFINLPYFLKKYSVIYTPSISSWLEMKSYNQKRVKKEQNFAGFAPNYNSQTISESQTDISRLFRNREIALPGAIDEVTEIANQVDGKMFIGEQATKQNFKRALNEYKVLHLAMHSLINHKEPMRSLLMFQKEKDTSHNGNLYASELYAMKTAADLVVMSACDSGNGIYKEGEGIMSLSRAMTYAGTPSQVISLWKVSDFASKKIMVQFYKTLQKGYSINQALHLSKIEYLKSIGHQQFSHPFYWASFVSFGIDQKIMFHASKTKNMNYSLEILSILVIIFIIIITYLVLKKKKPIA